MQVIPWWGHGKHYALLKKKYGVWTPGALESPGLLPLKVKRLRITLQSADLLRKMEEAAASTSYTSPLASCRDSDTQGGPLFLNTWRMWPVTPQNSLSHCTFLHKVAAVWFSFLALPMQTE